MCLLCMLFIPEKTTSMSTKHQNHRSSKGNDNNDSTFFHTQEEYGAWWRVDLSVYSCIHAVNLKNVASQGKNELMRCFP